MWLTKASLRSSGVFYEIIQESTVNDCNYFCPQLRFTSLCSAFEGLILGRANGDFGEIIGTWGSQPDERDDNATEIFAIVF